MGRRADGPDQQTRLFLARIGEQDDPRKAWGEIKQRIETLREAGDEVPVALLIAERNLQLELMAASQGR